MIIVMTMHLLFLSESKVKPIIMEITLDKKPLKMEVDTGAARP